MAARGPSSGSELFDDMLFVIEFARGDKEFLVIGKKFDFVIDQRLSTISSAALVAIYHFRSCRDGIERRPIVC